MSELKKNSGITIAALVVTIIMLIALAIVGIGAIKGEEGLFSKANHASVTYTNAEKTEQTILADLGEQINNLTKTNVSGNVNITDPNLLNWINKLENKDINLTDVTNNNLLDRLMNSKAAVDYMITNTQIIDAVANSKYAMESLGKSVYAGYKVIEKDNIRNKILSSEYLSYFEMGSTTIPKLSSNTNTVYSSQNDTTNVAWKAFDRNTSTYWISPNTTVTQYVGYNFNKNLVPYRFEVVNLYLGSGYRAKNFKLEGSVDGNNYFDLTSNLVAANNTTTQKFNIQDIQKIQYVRMSIDDKYVSNLSTGIAELQVYCREIPEGL